MVIQEVIPIWLHLFIVDDFDKTILYSLLFLLIC